MITACHKKCEVPGDCLYLPVQVGAYGKESIGFQRDDEGENISLLNPKYCELTGLYWAWKNLSYDYLGLSHYRRFFALHARKDDLTSVLSYSEAQQILNNHQIIVPKKRHYYIETLYSHYSHTFDGNHLDTVREILEDKYPNYVESFDQVMKQTGGYMFNMFIMPRSLCDSYFCWIFEILAELDKKIDSSGMTPFEKRYIGRVSEILFNVWLQYAKTEHWLSDKDIYEVPYIYIGRIDWPRKIMGFINAKLFHKKYDRSF